MSEWDEADLGDFFLLKACLKELRSCNDGKQKKEDHEAESYWKTTGKDLKYEQEKQYCENSGGKQRERKKEGRNSLK